MAYSEAGWSGADIEMALASETAEPTEVASLGRPADPIRQAVVDGLQSLLAQHNGEMPKSELAFHTRSIAEKNGLKSLPDSTRRDWQKLALKKWKAREKGGN